MLVYALLNGFAIAVVFETYTYMLRGTLRSTFAAVIRVLHFEAKNQLLQEATERLASFSALLFIFHVFVYCIVSFAASILT